MKVGRGTWIKQYQVVPSFAWVLGSRFLSVIKFGGQMKNIKLERWEDDEFIITINDKPVGATVNERNGLVVLEWLKYVGDIEW